MKAMLSQPMAGKTQEEIIATREKAIAALMVGIIFPCEYAEQLNFYTMKEDK